MKDLLTIRRYLHQHPELSNNEHQTSLFIQDRLKELANPPDLKVVVETGILATFQGNAGEHLLFRCELDALPIQEINDFRYKSEYEGVSHKCGHDGHMAILLGLAQRLSNSPPENCSVTLLFQPAEETGDGARNILKDGTINQLKPDMAFALHNVPGFPLGAVVVKEGPFNAAVKSMIIKYKGRTSHAAEPENGDNPALAIANTLLVAKTLEQPNTSREDFQLIVPVYSSLGERANGVSAGYGEVHLTMRCWTNDQMERMIDSLKNEIGVLCKQYGLQHEISFEEPFEAGVNDEGAVNRIRNSAARSNAQIIERDEAFKWGEDFGLITETYPGAMFGLGSGENCPALHNPDYDFPDELIEIGINLFYGIVEEFDVTN